MCTFTPHLKQKKVDNSIKQHLSLQISANDHENAKSNYLFLLIGFHVAVTLLEDQESDGRGLLETFV